MMERIRDVTVAEAIAAEAGTDATPELVLGDVVTPTLALQPRPPLAVSGYFPGTVGAAAAAVASNTSHAGIFGSGVGLAIVRVNWLRIFNTTAGVLQYSIRRVDGPFTGFPSIRAVPGYINAGLTATGGVFSITKTDTVAPQGLALVNANIFINATSSLEVLGPWILNDGILLVNCETVNTEARAIFGYEVWPAIRPQGPGG